MRGSGNNWNSEVLDLRMGEELAVKKKYRPGRIEEDPDDPKAIVVHYDIDEYVKGPGITDMAINFVHDDM